MTNCGGTCVDGNTSNTKCGAKGACNNAAQGNANFQGVACSSGTSCLNGVCGASCGALTNCGGTCVDGNTSNSRCGAKGTCNNATSTSPNFQGIACTGGQICTGGNCGCPSGQSLSNGICCPTGQTSCGGICYDGNNSNSKCGAKGTCNNATSTSPNFQGVACTGGTSCLNGICGTSCGALTNCGGTCVDGNTSNSRCGAKGTCNNSSSVSPNFQGVACSGGQICTGGNCSCPSGQSLSNGICCPTGQTNCGGICTNTGYDPLNCGACGNNCNTANNASAGHCTSSSCVITACRSGYTLRNGKCEGGIITPACLTPGFVQCPWGCCANCSGAWDVLCEATLEPIEPII